MTARIAKRPVRWILAVFGTLMGLVAIFVVHTIHRSRLVLREHLHAATVILETFPPEAARRPAIFEPEEEGNAWDLEDQVLGVIVPYGPRDPDLHDDNRLLLGGRTTYESKEASDVEQVEGQVDTLRHALRRRTALPRMRPGIFTDQAAMDVGGRLIASALRRHREGNDLEAAVRLILAIGLAEDVSRHGDYLHWHDLAATEQRCASVASQVLSAHSLSAADLGSWATWMDRLKRARPTLPSIIAIDSALSRKDVIEDFAGIAVPLNAPGPYLAVTWRDLWSRTLAKSRSVLDTDRAARALSEQARRPSWERAPSDGSESDVGSCYTPDVRILDIDAASELYLLLWRVSIALAWYEAEQGRFPESLGQLVPRYLAKEPISPRTGKALVYEGGKLGTDPGPGTLESITEKDGPNPDLFRWEVGRTKP